jgi:phage FluMu protein Com
MATETQLRKKIRCCKCQEIFTLLIETAGEPELSIACPYCGAPLHIDLAKYPKTETQIMRAAGEDVPKTVAQYVLPEVLETVDN